MKKSSNSFLQSLRLSNGLATAIAILFHAIGLAGMLWGNAKYFASLSSLNLLLVFILILLSQQEKNSSFFVFMTAAILIGFGVEVIGVHTGWLFGKYHYTSQLGYAVFNVPLIIGVNWFIVTYCSGISIKAFQDKLTSKFPEASLESNKKIKLLSVVLDGALLAVLFDWLMEPVAVKLGYWLWEGDIPFYNYFCWFVISSLLLWIFEKSRFEKRNKFAVHLLLIQSMFFLLLRTFL
jgi:putative membrane protein